MLLYDEIASRDHSFHICAHSCMLKSRQGITESCSQQGCACHGLLALVVVPEPGHRAVMDASCVSTQGSCVRGFLPRCCAAPEREEKVAQALT